MLCPRRWWEDASLTSCFAAPCPPALTTKKRRVQSRRKISLKLQVALKELRESGYWLRLLVRSGLIPLKKLDSIIDESNQLRAILSKAVATVKGKAKAPSESP